MIPQADSDAREMGDLIEDIHAENRRRKKYPRLKQIDINALCHRVADYIFRRRAVDDEMDELERKLGRPLKLAEASRIEGPLIKERRKLRNDLRYCSAGFEGGSGQFFSIAGESEVLIDEMTGWLPPQYHDLARKMSCLSKRERYRLIDNLYEKGTIDSQQRKELVRLFIDDLPDKSTCDISLKGDPAMDETINPEFCCFRHRRSDGTVLCEYRSKDKENTDESEKDESLRNEHDELSHDYSDRGEVSKGSDNSDDTSYEYTYNGESLDVTDASDMDVSMGDYSADFGYDYDGGDGE